MKAKSKIIVLLLTLALLCGAFVLMTSAETTTTTVSSYDQLVDAWSNAADGDTITIGESFKYSDSETEPKTTLNLEAGKTLTLDLGGHTLTVGDTAFLTSAGNLTVKNGTISTGNAIAVQTTGGELTLEDLTVKNEITDLLPEDSSKYTPITEYPSTIVGVSATTVNLTNVTISGVATRALTIAADSTVTARNATIRNAKLPGTGAYNGKENYCSAIEINGDNTVKLYNSTVEAIYIGFYFAAANNSLDETSTPKNSVLFEDSVLNVSFKENITGNDLKSFNSDAFNSGNLYKFWVTTTAHVSFTMNRSKVVGAKYAKGFGCEDWSMDTKACFTIRDSQLWMPNWACNTYMTFEGTNFLLSTAAPAFGGRKVGLRAAEGSRTYFTGAFSLTDIEEYSYFEDLKTGDNRYDTDNLALTPVSTAFDFYTKCGIVATPSSPYHYGMSYVLTPAGETPDTTEFANEKYDGCRTAMIYNADGTVHSVCYEGTLSWSIPDGGTLRFYEDVNIGSQTVTVANNVSIDMNGHWLSAGGSTTDGKKPLFLISAAVDVYFYTSKQGGGIRFLSADGGTLAYKGGTDPLISIGSNPSDKSYDAHVHLGYAETDGKVAYKDNGFTVLSGLIVQLYGGKVTVKGGNYYRAFTDYSGFFNVRYTTAENAEIFSFEDACFYNTTTILYSVVTTHYTGTVQNGMKVTFTNCVIDNAEIFSPVTNTCKNASITLTGCTLALWKAAVYSGMTVTLGEGCRYMTNITLPDSFFGDVAHDVNTDAFVFERNEVQLLTPAQLAAGGKTYTGATTTRTFTKMVTEDYVTVTYKGGNTELATQRWKKGSTPSEYKADAFADSSYYWYVKPTTPVNEATTYPAKLKTTESKITGNLTLYANITFNLYFKNDGFIKGVKYNNVSHYFTEAEEKDGYYYFPISDISPKDLSEAFTLEVILENGETTATYTVKTSLSKYAASVLANEATDDKTKAGKTLVLALLDYVREMSVTLGGKKESDDGIKAIDAGLKKYESAYTRKTWSKTGVKIPASGNITGASLMLTSTPGFVFYLDSTKYATAATVEVSINVVTKSYDITHAEGDNHYIIVDDIHVSKYNDALKVKLGEQSFEYSLDVYMQGFIKKGEEIPAYANALYSYVLAAKAYLEAQGN